MEETSSFCDEEKLSATPSLTGLKVGFDDGLPDSKTCRDGRADGISLSLRVGAIDGKGVDGVLNCAVVGEALGLVDGAGLVGDRDGT